MKRMYTVYLCRNELSCKAVVNMFYVNFACLFDILTFICLANKAYAERLIGMTCHDCFKS